MDEIILALVHAGYYRARISTLSEFDKIIGGMAWALQVFSYDINIDVFFTDSLDLGQKIALTERLVMLLIAMKCPYRVEPHQIVGLDYANLLPCIQWLIKRSEEVRHEHEAFNRLLALRHYHRVTNTRNSSSISNWRHAIPISILSQSHDRLGSLDRREMSQASLIEINQASDLLHRLNNQYKDSSVISFIQLQSHFRAANLSNREDYSVGGINFEEELSRTSDEETINDETRGKEHSDQVQNQQQQQASLSESERILHQELDNELLATNQKILNIHRKLDALPSDLEVGQYQRRYIELHQQLISKNKDVKKLFDLYNCLNNTKYYILKEINLLDSIASNLDLTMNSASNRNSFMQQFLDIINKIETIREDMQRKRDLLRNRCEKLNKEYTDLDIL